MATYKKKVDISYAPKLDVMRECISLLDQYVALVEEHELSGDVISSLEFNRQKENLDKLKRKVALAANGEYREAVNKVIPDGLVPKNVKDYY
jgi:hypothetical protein